MHLQSVRSRPLKPVQGLLAVLGLVAAVLLDSLLTRLLIPAIGEGLAAMVFWGLGVFIALWAMRRYVLAYNYALSGTALKVTHVYGRYQRQMEDVYLNSLLACGTPEAMRARFPGVRINRAVRKGCEHAPFAIAYSSADRTRILVLQPDDVIREALVKRVRGK